ncbi:unnamed protein product [Albugo candida]|uniref:Uncharacterized protein n=1 Tax=Albugo candida TaxID=65357 RepID=A0A024G579_9STRA|nr:unnamed protein product [Albugo candida]|eukprot:CCI42019.1 unnamed protein product [Albugo candida]
MESKFTSFIFTAVQLTSKTYTWYKDTNGILKSAKLRDALSYAIKALAMKLYFDGNFNGKALEQHFDGLLNIRYDEGFLAYCVALFHRKELSATQYNQIVDHLNGFNYGLLKFL